MSTVNLEQRASALHEAGVAVEDTAEAVQREAARSEGVSLGCDAAARAVEALKKHVDADVDAGSLDLEAAAAVKRYLDRAITVAQNLGKQAQVRATHQAGEASGLRKAIEILRKKHEVAKAQKDRLVAKRDGEERTIKEERLQEEAREQASEAEGATHP